MNKPWCRICKDFVEVYRASTLNSSDARVWCAKHDPNREEGRSVIIWRIVKEGGDAE